MQQTNGIKRITKNLFTNLVLTLILVASMIACGHNPKVTEPTKRTPEELQVNDIAAQMETDATALAKDATGDLQQPLSDLAEATTRYNNNSQRFGPGSLEARNAYDQIRYHEAVINKKLSKDAYPQLFDRWTKMQAQINEVGKHLGYKGGNYPE